MSGEKITLVKQTMVFVVDNMTETDCLGIISYDDTVMTNLHLTPMDAKGKVKNRDLHYLTIIFCKVIGQVSNTRNTAGRKHQSMWWACSRYNISNHSLRNSRN
jgi:hypothetical protein